MTEHVYKGTPITIEVSPISNGAGYWNSNNVVVYYNKNKIGEYVRNYSSYVETTFHPFKLNDVWYALYSTDYTATRVAKLTETEFIDWCGEESDSFGFCPVEYYVPNYSIFKTHAMDGRELQYQMYDNEFDNSDEESMEDIYYSYPNQPDFLEQKYMNYGFLCGCVWGDDSSWKLRFIDLSEVENKILKIEEKFGYFELPGNLKLKQCIRFMEDTRFGLTSTRCFDLPNNKFFVD